MTLTKVDLFDTLHWLKYAKSQLEYLDNSKKRLEDLIILIEEELDILASSPLSLSQPDTIIRRLLKTKDEINKEMVDRIVKKHGKNIDDVDKVIKLFNKESPELVVQLFFIDMELKNLGYIQ